MTAHPLDAIRIKIERAKRQIDDLLADVRTFLDSKPYCVAGKVESAPQQVVYYVERVECTPLPIPVQAGEIIHGLRSSLDHLATQLVLAGGGAPTKQTAFPILKNAAEYKAQSAGKIKGMRLDMIDAIDAIEPYNGGKGHQFWVLHELDIIDKHRVLLTIPARYRAFDMAAIAAEGFKGVDSPLALQASEMLSGMLIAIVPKEQICPVKEGDILLADKTSSEVNQNVKFAFQVAINEPGVVEGKPLIEAVQHFADITSGIVNELGRFL